MLLVYPLPCCAVGAFNLLQATGSEPLNLVSLFQQNEDEMGEFTGKDEFLVNCVFNSIIRLGHIHTLRPT